MEIAEFVWNAFEMFMDKCFAFARMMEIPFMHPCMHQIETSAFNAVNAEFIPNISTEYYIVRCHALSVCICVRLAHQNPAVDSSTPNVVQSWSVSTTYNTNILIKLSFQFASNTDYFECISFWFLLVWFSHKKLKLVMTTAWSPLRSNKTMTIPVYSIFSFEMYAHAPVHLHLLNKNVQHW